MTKIGPILDSIDFHFYSLILSLHIVIIIIIILILDIHDDITELQKSLQKPNDNQSNKIIKSFETGIECLSDICIENVFLSNF